MTDLRPEDFGATPTLEVRAYRDGTLFDRTLCESEEDAAVAVAAWEELDGVECVVEDLSADPEADSSMDEPVDVDDDLVLPHSEPDRRS